MPRQFRSRGKAMTKQWTGGVSDNIAITTTQILLARRSPAGGGDATILRNRGSFLVIAEPDAATDTDIVALGLIVVSTEAAGVGGASLPGPLNNPGADWLWHKFIGLDAIVATAGAVNALSLIERVEMDSKGMRKVTVQEELVLVGEVNSGDFSVVAINGGFRTLWGYG